MAKKDTGKTEGGRKAQAAKAAQKGLVLGEGGKLPSKTAINLYHIEKHTGKNLASLLVFLVFMAGLFLFSKYIVGGALEEQNRLETTYRQRTETLENLKAEATTSSDAQAKYSHYSNDYKTEDELALQDRMAILDVIERKLLAQGALERIDLEGNTATLTINSEKLSNVSELTSQLEAEKIVSYVTVSTAQKSLVPEAEAPENLAALGETETEGLSAGLRDGTGLAEGQTAEGQPTEGSAADQGPGAPAAEDQSGTEEDQSGTEEDQTETDQLLRPEVVTTMTIYFLTPDEVAAMAEETEEQTEEEEAGIEPGGTAGIEPEGAVQ